MRQLTLNSTSGDYFKIIQLLKELLSDGQSVAVKAGGISMYPYIRNGNTIIVKNEPIENLTVGDIIVFLKLSKLVAHRIVRINNVKDKYFILTKGDTSFRPEFIHNDNYVGKVTGIQTGGNVIDITTIFRKRLNKIIASTSFFISPVLRIINKLERTFT